MKKYIIYSIYIIFLLILNFKAISAEKLPFQYYPPKGTYPGNGGVPQTSKLKTTILGNGEIGQPLTDPVSGNRVDGFRFPVNRNSNYMLFSGLWVGGIVNEDTLVSTAVCKEYVPRLYGAASLQYQKDFRPIYVHDDTVVTRYYKLNEGEVFHCTFTDTNHTFYPYWQPVLEQHTPMGLFVTLKTYTNDISPFKNIVLLDYTITNRSENLIESAYVGMYVNNLVQAGCPTQFITIDDLVGSFRDKGTVYIMDNDGDLNITDCQNGQATGSMALKTTATYPQPVDTNFNWWTNWNYRFAPQKKGTPTDPFRIIGAQVIGTPTGDSNRYYVMSHKEWDYDQYLTKIIDQSDPTWVTVADTILTSISKGDAPNFLLSMGPYDLKPDSSVRIIFALIGTDFVHLFKDNLYNILSEKYALYYSNLFFDLFYDNLFYADLLTEEYLNPLAAPLGVLTEYIDSSTTKLEWDNYVFPEVTGYNIYLREVTEEYMLSHDLVKPGTMFDDLTSEVINYTSKTNYFFFENLSPDKHYIARVSQQSFAGESNYSDEVLVHAGTKYIAPSRVIPEQEFVTLNQQENTISFKWKLDTTDNIDYYKIFKAVDSTEAYMRYKPFLFSNQDDIPFEPKECFDFIDSSNCFYELQAYDSVANNISEYIDSSFVEGAYYWITAKHTNGTESEFSNFIKSVKAPKPSKDIVAIIGTFGGDQEFVYNDSLVKYYNELLEGYDYDLFMWSDSNYYPENCSTLYCTNWEDLANYKLIIVNEYTKPRVLTEEFEKSTKLFTLLSELGHDILYFGIPTGHSEINILNNIDSVRYDSASFEHDYMGLNYTTIVSWFKNYNQLHTIDSLSGFQTAIPININYPTLPIKATPSFFTSFIKEIYNFDNCTPFVPSFGITDSAEVIYKYSSAYPSTSYFQDKPVGVLKKNRNNKVYSFGFHLWAMQMESAKQLINYAYTNLSKEPQNTILPSEITLNQNYPNPFNAGTTISFTLPRTQSVSIDIFNILGRKIETLLPETVLSSGLHEVHWDGTNRQNKAVATGIYFYRVQSGDFEITKKMVLLK